MDGSSTMQEQEQEQDVPAEVQPQPEAGNDPGVVKISRNDEESASFAECHICQGLVQMFAYHRDRSVTPPETIKLGPWEKAKSTDCPGHKRLINWFVEQCQHGADENLGELMIRLNFYGPYIDKSNTSLLGRRFILCPKHLPSNNRHLNHIGTARILDQDVNCGVLRRWKNLCLRSHGAKCFDPLKIWSTRPAWLVDIVENRVVPGHEISPKVSFIALSYTWGTTAAIDAQLDDMTELQKHGSLEEGGFGSKFIPLTVRHAMYLTSVLDECYLWVDTLCIVHGDASTAEQLKLMGAIYANAIVTLVAAQGCADDGISGLKGIQGSHSQERKQDLIPFGELGMIVSPPRNSPWDRGHVKRKALYYKRGWTFQERKMAKRKIIFEKDLVRWKCHCSRWREDMVTDLKAIHKWTDLRDLARIPSFDSFNNIISKYARLDFRFDEDALPGIAGLLAILSRAFRSGFLYGIPEMFFDSALAWGSYGPLRRRSKPSGRQSLLGAALPSWSWIGWNGSLWMGDETFQIHAYNEETMSKIQETTPVTQWFTGFSPTTPTADRRRIRSSWFENRDRWKADARDSTIPLPNGGTRHNAETIEERARFRPTDESPWMWPDGCGLYAYTHEAFSEGITEAGSGGFFYPFPVADITEATQPDMPEQTEFLFGTTQSARVWTQNICKLGEYQVLYLHSRSGGIIGHLNVHTDEKLQEIRNISADHPKGLEIEVVAINIVRTHSRFEEDTEEDTEEDAEEGTNKSKPQQDESLPLIEVCDQYTVLWIEWEDGVAYRKGVGWIVKSKWEQLELKAVELVLG